MYYFSFFGSFFLLPFQTKSDEASLGIGFFIYTEYIIKTSQIRAHLYMSKLHPTIKAGLTTEEFHTLTRVTQDPFLFSTFVNVVHPVRGKTPFKLYPYQRTCLYYFLRERFNIILKFRQAGLTELIAMYCLWLAMYRSNKNIVILSLKERVAKKVLRKIKYMYRHLPEYLKVDIVNGRPGEMGTNTEMEFANGSTIASIPTTEDAGRSEGLSLLVIDEAAIMKWAKIIWAAAFPTLSTGGSAIVNSTPYGIGNWYHQTWVEACTGGNGFFPIRLRWDMHPERDINWYNEQRAALGARKTAQEIDGDFLTSGASVFDLMDIKAIEDELEDWLNVNNNPELRTHLSGTLLQYKLPRPNENYFLGADVSTGRSRDYSAFSIMNQAGEEYVSFKGKVSPARLADILKEWGTLYNKAVIAPEGNDVGLSTVERLQSLKYSNVYYSKALVRKRGRSRQEEKPVPGWYTTKQNRPVIIASLEEDIRNESVIVKDPRFVEEAYTFIYDEANRPIAMGKGKGADDIDEDDAVYTDDSIMAKAITNHIRKGRVKPKRRALPAK